jgi:hypothetical protein
MCDALPVDELPVAEPAALQQQQMQMFAAVAASLTDTASTAAALSGGLPNIAALARAAVDEHNNAETLGGRPA